MYSVFQLYLYKLSEQGIIISGECEDSPGMESSTATILPQRRTEELMPCLPVP